jgi:hypothetical protein
MRFLRPAWNALVALVKCIWYFFNGKWKYIPESETYWPRQRRKK